MPAYNLALVQEQNQLSYFAAYAQYLPHASPPPHSALTTTLATESYGYISILLIVFVITIIIVARLFLLFMLVLTIAALIFIVQLVLNPIPTLPLIQ
ncbi:hypothetical protein CVT25_010263 [Psilocybe cyanescens]|uniref:Uncharacterized protein n=1 Tax=Psilocybe cyanescens TaxID=93625 RepID=A0A409XD48_PSICY|nr:hypothetical protein CVT25_010263 [Psilocybe cyanescens]